MQISLRLDFSKIPFTSNGHHHPSKRKMHRLQLLRRIGFGTFSHVKKRWKIGSFKVNQQQRVSHAQIAWPQHIGKIWISCQSLSGENYHFERNINELFLSNLILWEWHKIIDYMNCSFSKAITWFSVIESAVSTNFTLSDIAFIFDIALCNPIFASAGPKITIESASLRASITFS